MPNTNNVSKEKARGPYLAAACDALLLAAPKRVTKEEEFKSVSGDLRTTIPGDVEYHDTPLREKGVLGNA